MKQKTITTDKATLLVVECPKTHYFLHDNGWKLIGRLPELTEDDAKEIVDSYEYPMSRDILGFEDYQSKWFDMKDTALDSLHTLLQANEVYFVNPLGDFDSFNKLVFNHSEDRLRDWKEAQSKVLDKERTYLFKKI